MESDTGILTEMDTYDWKTFLPMAYGTRAYNRYFGKLNTGKMKILKQIEAAGFKETSPGLIDTRNGEEIRKWTKELAQKALQ